MLQEDGAHDHDLLLAGNGGDARGRQQFERKREEQELIN